MKTALVAKRCSQSTMSASAPLLKSEAVTYGAGAVFGEQGVHALRRPS